MESDNEIAQGWLLYKRSSEGERDNEKYFESFMELTELCVEDPERAWRVILLLVEMDSSDVMLSAVGAGPMESLLANHGAVFIERTEQRAVSHPDFRRMLNSVWRNEIKGDVWTRLRKFMKFKH